MPSQTILLPFDANYIPPAPYLLETSSKSEDDQDSSASATPVPEESQPGPSSQPIDTAEGKSNCTQKPKSKKARLDPGSTESSTEDSDTGSRTTSHFVDSKHPSESRFIHLPLETLGEILSRTSSPKDILSVARTCKALCEQLLSPGATFIWKNMRMKVGLPDPQDFSRRPSNANDDGPYFVAFAGVRPFVGRESAYAAFVFDGGICECCGEETENMYLSYSLRIRVCPKNSCRLKIRDKRLINKGHHMKTLCSSGDIDPRLLCTWITVPWLESPHHFVSKKRQDLAQLRFDRVFRLSVLQIAEEWLSLDEDAPVGARRIRYNLRKRVRVPAQGLPEELPNLTEESCHRVGTAFTKTCIWMELCYALASWQSRWLERTENVQCFNHRTGVFFAFELGCEYSELMDHSSFGEFAERKLLDHEEIDTEDLNRIKPTVAQEIYEYQTIRDHKRVRYLKENNTALIWKFYQKLMSTKHDDKSLAFPSFPVFLSLPAVQLLQSPDLAEAKMSVERATESRDNFMHQMIMHQLKKWTNQVKFDLLQKIDPSGAIVKEWENRPLTDTTPELVCGRDAWWRCRMCNTVEVRYAADECLDFKGVCRHQCPEKDGKKKKRGVASVPWAIVNFIRDEQASAVMASCLRQLKASEILDEHKLTKAIISTLWLCKNCEPPLLVQSGSLAGHSHRHAGQMDIEMVTNTTDLTCYPARPTPLGLAQWLMFDSRGREKGWTEMNNYSCLHCLTNETGNTTSISTNCPPNEMTLKVQQAMDNTKKLKFNGIRSHLASKHKIYKIRDEDFFCSTRVQDFFSLLLTFRHELPPETIL